MLAENAILKFIVIGPLCFITLQSLYSECLATRRLPRIYSFEPNE